MTSIKQQLDTMLKRSIALCGYTLTTDENGKTVKVGKDEAVKNFLTTLAADSTDSKEIAAKMVAAWDEGTNGELQKALNATRVEAVGNFIAAESTFRSGFYNVVTLQPDEEPWYINETRNEVRVGSMGDDGSPEQVRILKPEAKTAIGLYTIASDWVQYKTLDILRGDVSQSALRTIDIARDVRFKLDRIHYTLLNAATSSGGCFGVFSYENARAAVATRVYLPHSGIVTAHLPTTNDVLNGTTAGPTGDRWTVRYYDAAASTLSGFRPAVMACIQDYSSSWANALPGGGMLSPTGDIIVPSSDIINIALGLLPSNDDTANSLQAQVQSGGYFSLNVLGRPWRFIPDITITAGTCFPMFNLKPGLAYEKPSWDKEFVERNDIENWERRKQKKGYGCAIPAQYRPRALRIKYIA